MNSSENIAEGNPSLSFYARQDIILDDMLLVTEKTTRLFTGRDFFSPPTCSGSLLMLLTQVNEGMC